MYIIEEQWLKHTITNELKKWLWTTCMCRGKVRFKKHASVKWEVKSKLFSRKYIVKKQLCVWGKFLNVAINICRPIHTRCHDTVWVYVPLLERIAVNHMIASRVM